MRKWHPLRLRDIGLWRKVMPPLLMAVKHLLWLYIHTGKWQSQLQGMHLRYSLSISPCCFLSVEHTFRRRQAFVSTLLDPAVGVNRISSVVFPLFDDHVHRLHVFFGDVFGVKMRSPRWHPVGGQFRMTFRILLTGILCTCQSQRSGQRWRRSYKLGKCEVLKTRHWWLVISKSVSCLE